MVGDYQRIKEFLKAGNFYWNSGMFCFKAGVFLEELKRYEPEVYEKAKIAFDNSNNAFLPLDKSMEIPSISVDYAVMERTQNLQAVIGSFRWCFCRFRKHLSRWKYCKRTRQRNTRWWWWKPRFRNCRWKKPCRN